MITRAITIFTFATLSIFLIFCYTAVWRNTETAAGDKAAIAKDSAHEHAVSQARGDTATAPADPSTADRARASRQMRSLPVMNIPAGFFMFAVPAISFILIYIVGIIVDDISREDKKTVENIFGTLN